MQFQSHCPASIDEINHALQLKDFKLLDRFSDEDLLSYRNELLPLLLESAKCFECAASMNRGYRGLVAAACKGFKDTFEKIIYALLINLKTTTISHPWRDPKQVQLAHFCAVHALNVTKAQPMKVFMASQMEVVELYMASAAHGAALCAASPKDSDVFDHTRKLHSTVSARLDAMLALMFRNIGDTERINWLISLFSSAPSSVSAVTSLNIMCGMCRDIHLQPCSNADNSEELLIAMFLWLPGMSSVLVDGGSTDLQRHVINAAAHLPHHFFTSAVVREEGPADTPPYHKWWYSAVRVASSTKLSPSLMGLVLATLSVGNTASLERTVAIWTTLVHFSSPSNRASFFYLLQEALNELNDDTFTVEVLQVFQQPIRLPRTSPSITARISRCLANIIGDIPSSTESHPPHLLTISSHIASLRILAGVFAHSAPFYFNYILRSPSAIAVCNKDHTLGYHMINIMCSPDQLGMHPTVQYHALQSVKEFSLRSDQGPEGIDGRWMKEYLMLAVKGTHNVERIKVCSSLRAVSTDTLRQFRSFAYQVLGSIPNTKRARDSPDEDITIGILCSRLKYLLGSGKGSHASSPALSDLRQLLMLEEGINH